ncbi:unnamed protein product [Danaus chrysippus]|uniref:(African queen) hypothetical protein n=1 Tax=Danaus chrysippus TaxID=151541 RepID=A0A8J2QUB3_9NEOP|nr:unnamed protein product [Danaus chrysippus]
MNFKDHNNRHMKIKITRYHNEEIIHHKSSGHQSSASVEGFRYHDYRSQQSSVSNNFAHYGYTTAMGSPSPVTLTPSPAPTNVSNESELELFCE